MHALKYNERHNCILEHYMLVQTIANRLNSRLPPSVEVDVLINIGAIGLIEAVDRFDPSRGVPFRSYAEIRIQGAMLDHLRKLDWVPRTVRQRHNVLEQLTRELHHKFGRKPTRTELAEALNLEEHEFDVMVHKSKICHLISFDAPAGEEGDSAIGDFIPSEIEATDVPLQKREMNMQLHGAISILPEREREVVEMYYFQQKTLKYIGASLGVTESRACQLRASAVRRLRRRMEKVYA